MIGETFESVSQIAHTLAGVLIVLLLDYYFHLPRVGIFLVLAWACYKEFWYDLRNEAPAISGGIWGSLRDFAFYMLGGGVGYGLVVLQHLAVKV